MSRVEKLFLWSVSLCVAVATFAVSKSANACSAPAQGWSTAGPISFDHPLPTDGVVAFKLWAYGIESTDLLNIEVRDAQNSVVDGNFTTMVLEEGESGPPGSESDYLIMWKPSSPLSPQSTYDLSIEAEHPYASELTVDEDLTFETASGAAAQLPTASITSATIDVAEMRAGFECCTHDSFCDSCHICEQCWATRYAYRPQVRAELSLPSSTALARQVYTELRVAGEATKLHWNWRSTTTETGTFDENASGPFCVEVATISLITGDEIHAEEECFDQSDLPSYTERQLTGEGPPPECAPDGGQPDAGSSDVGTVDSGTPDTGQPDTGQSDGGGRSDGGSQDATSADTGSSGGSANGGGGCSQSGPAVPPFLAMMVALLGMGLVRWRSEAA